MSRLWATTVCPGLRRSGDLAGGLLNVVIAECFGFTLFKILAHSRCRAIFMDALAARRGSLLKRNRHSVACYVLEAAPKSFAAMCHLPGCWSGADAVVSTNWITAGSIPAK